MGVDKKVSWSFANPRLIRGLKFILEMNVFSAPRKPRLLRLNNNLQS